MNKSTTMAVILAMLFAPAMLLKSALIVDAADFHVSPGGTPCED